MRTGRQSERAAGWGALVVAVVGAAAAARGAISGVAVDFRTGVVLLIVGCAGLLAWASRRNARLVMDHQERMLSLDAKTRQRYAEMGWRAAVIDMQSSTPDAGKVHVLPLPQASPRRGA